MSGTAQAGDGFEATEFGDYLLLRRIGTGGMSEIYLARPQAADRQHERYALKRLLPELAQSASFVDLFRQEARLAARLRHPNVVQVHDLGVVEGRCYMVAEYVEGLDCWKITRRLARDLQTLPLAQVIQIVVGALRGLEYVHALRDERGRPLGIVHRDVSPSNIFVSRRGEVKLGDFGIALIADKEVESQRRSRLRGKIRYLSPEQVRGQQLDARSDLFSVGVLLAELIMGRSPFRGQTDIALLLNIRDVRVHLAEDLDERTPPELRRILMRALARDPEDRHPTARAMVDDLLSFVDDEGFALDPAELAATVERLIRPGDVGDQDVLRDTLTPLAGEPVGPREPRPQATAGPDEQTPCLPLCEYRVRRGGGDEQGPMSYAELVERIMNGQVRPDDEVSMNRGPFRAVSATPDLQRHLPMLTPVTTRIDGPGVPDRQGLFAAESVSAVFLLLARHKESGLLVADSGAVRKEVYFADGHPIYASSNLASELLGEWLVARGVLSRMELDMALALLPRYEGHLGDTLVAMELVDPLTLFSHITEQVCHKILDLFKWRTGGWAFFRGVVCEKRAFPLSSSGPELLHEGIRRSLTAEEIDKWWSAMEPRALMPEEQPDPPVEWWPISDLERLALGAVDRPLPAVQAFRRLRERASMATRETLLRAFHFCVAAGLLRPAE